MADNPGFHHASMDAGDKVGGNHNNASASHSHNAMANTGQPLDVQSDPQAGYAMHTWSFSDEGLADHHESSHQYSSEYGDDSGSGSEVDETLEDDSEMSDEETERQYVVLGQGTGSANESSDGSESGDESNSDGTARTIKDGPESPSEYHNLNDSGSMHKLLNTLGTSAQQHDLTNENGVEGSIQGAARLAGSAAAGTGPSLASGPQSHIHTNLQHRTRLPDTKIPTEAAIIASMQRGLPSTGSRLPILASVTSIDPKCVSVRGFTIPHSENSNTMASSGCIISKRLSNVDAEENGARPFGQPVTGPGVNLGGPGTTSTVNPVMRRLTLHNKSHASTVQNRFPLDLDSLFSAGISREVIRCLTHPATTISHLRYILEVHKSRVNLPDDQVPEQLRTCWFSIQHQLNVNPRFRQDISKLYDLKMNLPTSPEGQATHGDAMVVDNNGQVHDAQIGHTGGASDFGMNSSRGVQAVGDSVANATAGAPAVGNPQPARTVVAIGARGREVYVTSTAEDAIANLQARAARGDYLYGDGTATHPDAIALAKERPLGPLPANTVPGGVRFVNGSGVASSGNQGGGQGGSQAAAGGAPSAPGNPSAYALSLPWERGCFIPVKRGSQAISGASGGVSVLNAGGCIIGAAQAPCQAAQYHPGRISLDNAPGIAIGSGTTVAVPPIYVPPMPKVTVPPVLVAGDVPFSAEYTAKARKAASFVPPMTEAAAAEAAAAAASSPQPKKKAKRASKSTGSATNNVAQSVNNAFLTYPHQCSTQGHALTVDAIDQRFNAFEDRMNARFDSLAAALNQHNQVQHHRYESDLNEGDFDGFNYPDPPAPQ